MTALSEVDQLLQRIRELEEWRRRLVIPETVYPAWDDQQINIGSVQLDAQSPPSWESYKSSQVLEFGPNNDEYIYFTAQLDHGYREGTDIEFHLHLAYPDAGVGDTVWNFSYSWADIGGTFPVASNVLGVAIAAPGVADYHQLAEIEGEIDGTGKNISSVLLCSLSRQGFSSEDDTYANSVYLVALDFHIRINSIGSRTMLTKAA